MKKKKKKTTTKTKTKREEKKTRNRFCEHYVPHIERQASGREGIQ
jgi:hypothetical protein